MPDNSYQFFSRLEEKYLSPKRYHHCLGVAKTAEQLAKKYQVNSKKAKLAGLLHDFYKETPKEIFINLIKYLPPICLDKTILNFLILSKSL